MLLMLTAFSWAALAYVFRAQIPVIIAAVKTDIVWLQALFSKAPAVPTAPAPTPPPAPPAA